MTVSPQYETYSYTARGARLRSQSIVECRLSDWADNRLLAVRPSVVFGGAEVVSGEVRYGGKLFFSVVGAAPDGTIIGAERGAEFSHRAPCEDAAPAQSVEVVLQVEKTETRPEGRSIILSAIVTAEIRLLVPTQIRYLTGGAGVVCDYSPVRIGRVEPCSGTISLEEEFETEYVGDVLLHSEQVCLTRVVAAAGCLDVSGEINLGVLAKREGENEVVAYERLIPFRAEIPCDNAVTGMPCDARVCISSVNLTATCDEEKDRCRIAARIDASVRGRLYRADEVRMAADAFCPGRSARLQRAVLASEEPLCAFTAAERVSGTAVADGPIEAGDSMQAAAVCETQIAATVSDGAIEAEGVLNAVVFCKDAEGQPKSLRVSLPFAFPVRSDRAHAGDVAEISAACCGVSVRQRRPGELEAEGSLKLFVTLYSGGEYTYIEQCEAGEATEEDAGAITVFLPTAGDTLWQTAKKLGRAPEELKSSNPELTFPLHGGERIVVYRRKEIGN